MEAQSLLPGGISSQDADTRRRRLYALRAVVASLFIVLAILGAVVYASGDSDYGLGAHPRASPSPADSRAVRMAPRSVLRNAKYQFDQTRVTVPPDVIMAVSEDRIVSPSNVDISIYLKPDLTRLFHEDEASFINPAATGDGYVIFDPRSRRFFYTSFGVSVTSAKVITSNATYDAGVADYGPQTFTTTAPLVLAVPITGANPPGTPSLTNNVTGRIVLFEQGGGLFSYDKAFEAQAKGAVGIIFYSSTPGSGIGTPNDNRNNVTIPTVGVSYETGVALTADAGQSVTIKSLSSFLSNNTFAIAVSKTSSPSSAADWYTYTYLPATSDLTDYPKPTVDETTLYISTQNFRGLAFGNYSNAEIVLFDKAALLAGPGGVVTPYRTVDLPDQNFLWPVQLRTPERDQLLPTFFIGMDGSQNSRTVGATALRVYFSDQPFQGIQGFTSYVTIPLPTPMSFDTLVHAPQPAPGSPIDDLAFGLVMSPVQYDDSIWLTIPFHAANQSMVRWVELDISSFLFNGTITIRQWGDLDQSPGNSVIVPSINVDKHGSVAVAFTLTGPNQPPILAYTGRLATDPPGTMRYPFQTPIPSHYAYSENTPGLNLIAAPYNRWGDYSGCLIDPTDHETFWITVEYPSQLSSDNDGTTSYAWTTGIVSFRIEPLGGDDPTGGPTPCRGPQGKAPTSQWSSGQAPHTPGSDVLNYANSQRV